MHLEMKSVLSLCIVISVTATLGFSQGTSILPQWNKSFDASPKTDWLVDPPDIKANIYRSSDGKDIILFNGLIRRTFRLNPNLACIGYINATSGQQLLRAVKPEARISVNGLEYSIGGLLGQKEQAYLIPSWVDEFKPGPNDFKFVDFAVGPIVPFLNWKAKTWASNNQQATGKMLSFTFQSSVTELKGLIVKVNYELYDKIPLIVKWISIENRSEKLFRIDRVVNEILALVEEESAVVGTPEQMKKQHGIYVETNYAFNNAMRYDISDQTTHWKTDSSYTSQVNYYYQTPCLLEVYPEKVSGIDLKPGESPDNESIINVD